MTETISHGQYGIRTRMKPEDRTSQYVAENVQRLWQRDSNKEDEHMKKEMKYRVVSEIGGYKSTIAEVISENWAESFAEDVRRWLNEPGADFGTKVYVEKIKEG